MRPIHLLLVLAPLAAVGCTLFNKNPDPPRPTTPVTEMPAPRFVAYLNNQASRLQSMVAHVQVSGSFPGSLSANLAAVQPKYFRMRGEGTLAGEFDLGSNSEQFWVFTKIPGNSMFVYASHRDFDEGRARLPDGIAFEPEWVMQALGMHIFPNNVRYSEPVVDQKDRTYTLSWAATTPTGVPIRKEVVFDADDAREGRPQVKRHVIRDARNRILCSATIKSVATLPLYGSDPRVPQPQAQVSVQYPTHVVLHWELQKFELDLKLSDVHINQPFPPEENRRYFSFPTDYKVQPINLADYRFSAAQR